MKTSKYSLKPHLSKKYLYQNLGYSFHLFLTNLMTHFFMNTTYIKQKKKYRFILRSALNIFSTA